MHILQFFANLHSTSHSTNLSCATCGTSASTSEHVACPIFGKRGVRFFGKTLTSSFSKFPSGQPHSSPSSLCQLRLPTPECCICRGTCSTSRFQCLMQSFSVTASANLNRSRRSLLLPSNDHAVPENFGTFTASSPLLLPDAFLTSSTNFTQRLLFCCCQPSLAACISFLWLS